MPPEEQQQLDRETTALSKELNEMLNAKNRIAEIEQEFLQLNPEQHYFEEYYASYSDVPMESLDKLSSQKLLALWMEFEQHAERETRLGLLQKISIMFRFNRNALKLFIRAPEQVIPYLQNQFYFVKRRELEAEKQELNRKLERYAFDAKMDELTQKSLRRWQHGIIGGIIDDALKRMISAGILRSLPVSTRWCSARPIPLRGR